MNSIGDYIKNIDIQPKKRTSERAQITKEIYEIYISARQKIFRKKQNWTRYIQWLKDNRTLNSPEAQKKFKKSKQYIREHDIKTFCFFLSPIPTADLYYVLSVAKDMNNRNENFGGYIMANLSNKVKTFEK